MIENCAWKIENKLEFGALNRIACSHSIIEYIGILESFENKSIFYADFIIWIFESVFFWFYEKQRL